MNTYFDNQSFGSQDFSLLFPTDEKLDAESEEFNWIPDFLDGTNSLSRFEDEDNHLKVARQHSSIHDFENILVVNDLIEVVPICDDQLASSASSDNQKEIQSVSCKDKTLMKTNLSERKDVVNRAILRGIKKYFMNFLLEGKPEYQNKRICRVNKEKLIEDIKDLVGKSASEADYLSKCMFSIVRPNSIDFVFKFDSELQEVTQFINSIQKYSHSKLSGLYTSRFFTAIFKVIYGGQDRQERIEKFFKVNPLMLKYKDSYVDGLNKINEGIEEASQML